MPNSPEKMQFGPFLEAKSKKFLPNPQSFILLTIIGKYPLSKTTIENTPYTIKVFYTYKEEY